MNEVLKNEIDVVVNNDVSVEFENNTALLVNNNIDANLSEPEYVVEVSRKEYNVAGDELYIPRRFEDSPTWMQNLITQVVDTSISAKINDINEISMSLESMIGAMEVAKNTYEMSIVSSNDIDERINTAVTTLNSNMQDADSTILEVAQTRTTPDEASAITIDVISAQFGSTTAGTIGATVSELQTAIANEEEARSTSIEILTSSIEGAFNANATATNYLNTYVGVTETGEKSGTGLLADVEILQKQNDGVIETTTGIYDVMINPENPNIAQLITTSEPYATWRALDTTGINNRLSHIGDVYVKYSDTANGAKEYIASYKFIRSTVDETSPYATDSDGFTWALIIDQAAQDAYEQALNAFDLADNKRRVFVSNPTVPYDVGDLWLVQAGSNIIGTTQGGRIIQAGDMLRCSETKEANGLYEHNDWIPADNYRESMNAIQADLNSWRTGTYAPFVTSIQTQVDGKSETFYQNSIPTGRIKSLNAASNSTLDKYVGDLWKNIYVGTVGGYLGNNTEYVYTKTANGSNWNYDWKKMEVPDIVFDTIDTKKSIYSGNSVPVAVAPDIVEINDMWITGSAVVAGYDKESIYVWNGTSWIKPLKYTDDSTVVSLSNGLANGTVTLNLSSATIDGNISLSSYVAAEIDKEVVVFSGSNHNAQTGMKTNDIYIEKTTAVSTSGITIDVVNTWKYNGTVWIQIGNNSNLTALADLADGKRTVFSGNTVPAGAVNRDVWIPSATNGVYIKGEIYQYNGTSWIIATKYSADIESVRGNLQSQIDGKVDTYYQGTVPTGMTALNNGDYWYCTVDVSTYKKGKVYKYAHATTSWVETADVSRYAFDTADGKASIFTSTAQPTAYKINDMLIVTGSFNNGTTTFSDGVVLSSNATRTAGFVAADWVKKINDTEDLDLFVSSVYNPAVLGLQNQIDGKIENWFTLSTNDPKVSWVDADTRLKHNGDLWYQTDTKISYYYTSSTHTWNILDDAKAIQALSDAATAQTAANNAQTSANTANSLLADISSDSKFTQSEKSLVKKEWDSIQSEYTKNLAQGTSYSVSTAAYTTAYNALNTYITPLLASLTTTSDIVGTIFRSTFKSYYDANVDLLNAVSNKINLIADGKITSYYMATFSAVQAMSAAWTVSEKTSNIGDLAVVHNDTTVDNNGTWRWDGANWITTRDKKLVALASQVTALSTDLQSGDGTWADADSTLTNSLTTTINDKTAAVESKFAYNSVIGINGIYKKSGFGLTTNYVSGSGTEVDPYASEFWIDASRFKFTNSNQTGQVAPFTIDATGSTPQITFNGVVNFSNVTGTPGTGSNILTNSAPKIGSETKGWSTWTNSGMTVTLTAGWAEWRPTGGASIAAYISGSPSIGTVFDINQSSIPVIAGKRYEASAYISAHRTNSYVLVVFYSASGEHVGQSTGNIINFSGSNALVNWSRSSVFVTAPSNAAVATYIVRSDVTGVNPYCFISYGFLGIAEASQTTPSNWSEGTGASVSSGEVVSAINNGQTTTIDGGKITAGSITADRIEANSINAAHIDAYAIVGKHISGGTITGTQIIGSVIKGSFIDLTTTLALTNWQYYTPATIPDWYAANFAHHNDGSLVVDSQWYVRLAGQQNFVVPPIVTSGTISGTTTRTLNLIYDLYSWDSYNVDTLQRGIRQDTAFTSTAELVFSGYGGGPLSQSEHAGYDSNFSFRFLDKNISVDVSSFGSNDDTVANSSISFNDVAVASASGSLGIGLDRPWDTGWLDYSTTIKGIPIRIKTTIDAIGAITFEFKATLSSINGIINHSLNDVIKIISVYVGGNTRTRNLTYNINFPSVWVQ